MSHYFADIKAGIISTLAQATKIKALYDYEETQPSGYPAATVTPAGSESEFLDTTRLRRDFLFSVKLYQERAQTTPVVAEQVMTKLVDQVVAVFDDFANTTLVNTVVFLKPVQVKWGYLNVPDADVRSCEITLLATAAQ